MEKALKMVRNDEYQRLLLGPLFPGALILMGISAFWFVKRVKWFITAVLCPEWCNYYPLAFIGWILSEKHPHNPHIHGKALLASIIGINGFNVWRHLCSFVTLCSKIQSPTSMQTPPPRPLCYEHTHTHAHVLIFQMLCAASPNFPWSHYLRILIHTPSSACSTKDSLLHHFQRHLKHKNWMAKDDGQYIWERWNINIQLTAA